MKVLSTLLAGRGSEFQPVLDVAADFLFLSQCSRDWAFDGRCYA